MSLAWRQGQDRAPRGETNNSAETLSAVVDAAFLLKTSREGREVVYQAVWDAVVSPERITYDLAVLITGSRREVYCKENDLFGDVTDLVIEEAKQRLANEPEEVLDELAPEKKF